MSKSLHAAQSKRPTLQNLAVELNSLRERVEDLEDLQDLREAVERNAGDPLVPWDRVKKDLKIG
jgi:hypothetical protein